jgi:hypothetical protein
MTPVPSDSFDTWCVRDEVVVERRSEQIQRFEPRSGRSTWTRSISGRVKELGAGDGCVLVKSQIDSEVEWTGFQSEAGESAASCEAAASIVDDYRFYADDPHRVRIAGGSVEIRRVDHDRISIARSGGKSWRMTIKIGASLMDSIYFAVSPDRVFVAGHKFHDDLTFAWALLSLADGSVVYTAEEPVPDASFFSDVRAEGATISGDRVFLFDGRRVRAFDLASGKRQW